MMTADLSIPDRALRAAAPPVPGGFPSGIALALAQLAGARTFVETGTYQGGTTRWASANFQKVYTIERAEQIYHAHNAGLRSLGNVDPRLGDSREVLRAILPGLQTQPAVFWLDGHWSGGETAGEGDECPLLGELAVMASRTDDIVLIDDARLFLSAPPLPHSPDQWPTIVDVIAALFARGRRPYIQIVDDVIISIPDTQPLRKGLTDYAQERAGVAWTDFTKRQKGASGAGRMARFLRKVRSRLGMV